MAKDLKPFVNPEPKPLSDEDREEVARLRKEADEWLRRFTLSIGVVNAAAFGGLSWKVIDNPALFDQYALTWVSFLFGVLLAGLVPAFRHMRALHEIQWIRTGRYKHIWFRRIYNPGWRWVLPRHWPMIARRLKKNVIYDLVGPNVPAAGFTWISAFFFVFGCVAGMYVTVTTSAIPYHS